MTKNVRAPWRAFTVLALIAAAVAVLAATTGVAATHTMTPAVGANPVFQNLGALGSPANQPQRLRQCQLSGTCQGPDQIRNAYGVQQLLDQGVTGAGRTIVIIDAYGSVTIAQDLATQSGYF